MIYLYFIGLFFYKTLIQLVSPFNSKARLFLEGRKGLVENLSKRFEENKKQVAWFHCASLGEFEQARPLIERFKQEFPDYFILLTFFSPSGYEIRKNYAHADFVCYLPTDTKSNAGKFISITKPSIVFFTKYEFWYYYLKTLSDQKIPVISFSAIFRSENIFFKSYGGFFRNILTSFIHIFVQDNQSKQLLESIDIKNITVAGDTRFDRVLQIFNERKKIQVAEEFTNGQACMVCGSVWKQDLEVLIPFIKNHREIKFIIAPHEIHEEELKWIETALSFTIRYSKASKELDRFQVLLIDNIGMLSSLYSYGKTSYVGGAFGKGLHNILEPTVNGIPVFFGPNFKKFKEAKDLIDLGCAFPITTSVELENKFERATKASADIKNELNQYFLQNCGATDKIINYTKSLIR